MIPYGTVLTSKRRDWPDLFVIEESHRMLAVKFIDENYNDAKAVLWYEKEALSKHFNGLEGEK